MTDTHSLGLSYARKLDSSDVLRDYRHKFLIEDPDLIYVDGNSLGRLPKATPKMVLDLVERQWGERLIRSWNEGWFDLPERIGAKIAKLLGVRSDEVIMGDSTSVNLFKLALAAMRLQPAKTKIVTDDLNFPSDLYILQSVVQSAGRDCRLEVVPSHDEISGNSPGLESALDGSTALLVLSHTTFKSGFTYDMAMLTEAAHKVGALVLWDTSHSVGSVPIDLERTNADLAIGCTYKYLNGGPGAPAFLYVRRALQEKIGNPVAGWMGQEQPFDFGLTYKPTPGLRRFLSGTPPVLSLASAEVGIDILIEAGIDKVRAKSIQQSEYFISLWEKMLSPLGFVLRSPRDFSSRGSHVSLGHPQAWRINQALIKEKNVIPDFRQPDNIRLGFAPLYNSFSDVYFAADRLRDVVETGLYENYDEEFTEVT